MALHTWKTRISALLVVLGCVDVAQASELDPTGPVPVLIVDSNPSETPDPTCGVCSVVVDPDDDEEATKTTAIINFDGDFVGDVELVVWLDSEERDSVWIRDVTIVDGQPLAVDVQANEGWDWNDVRFAWTRFY